MAKADKLIVADPANMPNGLIPFMAEFESADGMSTLTQPIAAKKLSEAAQAAEIWGKSQPEKYDLKWVAEFGWTEGLV